MNRIVLITGGTSGIGLATAKKFLENGDKVVVASVDTEEAFQHAESTLGALGEVKLLHCNLAEAKDCQAAAQHAIDAFGRIDVLVNVAGVVGKRGAFLDVDLDDILNTIQINLMGTINIGQSVGRHMATQRSGAIINVGSICGTIANTENIGYHSSKGGVKMATQAMARELSPFGIRVVGVAPGWVKTGMIDKDIEEIGSKLHMKGRIIEPFEVANAIYLLSLPEASAINGSMVMVDDGYSSFKGVDGFVADE